MVGPDFIALHNQMIGRTVTSREPSEWDTAPSLGSDFPLPCPKIDIEELPETHRHIDRLV